MMLSGTWDRNKVLIIADIFLISLCFYLLILSGFNGFDVSMARIDVLSSLTNNFDLNVSFNTGVKGVDGRDYSWFGIGSVLLCLPFYLLGKFIGNEPAALVPLVNVILSSATNCLIFVFTHSIGYSKRISVMTSLIYGFTTMACYYAKDPGDQSIETFFIFLSVYCMYRNIVTGKISYTIYASLSIGMAIITRINAVIAIPAILTLPILEYLFSNQSREKFKETSKCLSMFFICLFPFIALLMWYNFYRYGSVLETGYGIMASKWGLNIFGGTNPFIALSGFLFSPGKGFFYYSPPAIFFIISIHNFIRSNLKSAVCFIVIILSYFVFYSKYFCWNGDWAWGPRFLLAILPYFIIPAASILHKPSNKLKLFIVTVLVLGITVQILAISINPYRYFMHLQLIENVQFIVANGNGVQPIQQVPSTLYFNWSKSPILYHINFFKDSIISLLKHRHGNITIDTSSNIDIISLPYMNTFDFQWLYLYYANHAYNGFYCIIILFFSLLLCCKNLHKKFKNEYFN